MANGIEKKKNCKIQQLTFKLIIINDSDFDTISNSRSKNMEFPQPQIRSARRLIRGPAMNFFQLL